MGKAKTIEHRLHTQAAQMIGKSHKKDKDGKSLFDDNELFHLESPSEHLKDIPPSEHLIDKTDSNKPLKTGDNKHLCNWWKAWNVQRKKKREEEWMKKELQ